MYVHKPPREHVTGAARRHFNRCSKHASDFGPFRVGRNAQVRETRIFIFPIIIFILYCYVYVAYYILYSCSGTPPHLLKCYNKNKIKNKNKNKSNENATTAFLLFSNSLLCICFSVLLVFLGDTVYCLIVARTMCRLFKVSFFGVP